MYRLNYCQPGALPPFRAFALTARGSLWRPTRGVAPYGRLPRATGKPAFVGFGMAFSHPPVRRTLPDSNINQLAYITVDAVQMFVQDLWACGFYMKDEM